MTNLTNRDSPAEMNEPQPKSRWRNIVLIVAVLLAVVSVGTTMARSGLLDVVFDGSLSSQEKLAHVKTFFESFGQAAPIAYVVVVAIEVIVAPIPGAMLYAPGGIVFGGFWGGLLSLTGNVVGAAVSCQLMRVFGGRINEKFLHKESVQKLEKRIADHGVLVIFLLRLNPLTSSDMVSYAAGLTPMPVWKLCLGTSLGMAPLCWVQAYTADHLLTAFPQLLYPLIVLCAVYVVIVAIVMWRLLRKGVKSEPVES